MKPLLSVSLAAVAAVFLFSSLVSCGPTEDPKVPVSSVSVNPGSLNLEIGGTAVLTATVTPSDATDKTVTWSTSNPSVASVNNGSVTAVAEGSATITATAGGKSGTCQVTVNPKPEALVLVVGDVATVPAAGATVEVDVQYNVDYTVEVEESAQSWIHYLETRVVQSGKLVFKVDANDGDKRSGKVTIKDNAGKVDPVTITIVQEKKIEVESVTLDRESAEIETGKTLQLTAMVVPENAMDKTVTWSSDNETVATVDENGLVTGVTSGTAAIVARAGEKSASCSVTVKPSIDEIERAALVALYQATGGDNWKINDNWCSDKPLDEWYGVTTDVNGQVVRIELVNNNLKGVIPSEIGDLKLLSIISLEYNNLTGAIPESLYSLKHLSWIHLYSNSLSGELSEKFWYMPSLSELILDDNDFTGCLTAAIGNATNLAFLHLGSNKLTGTIPDQITDLKNLMGFSIANSAIFNGGFTDSANQISGSIPDNLDKLKKLRYFLAGNNNLEGTVPTCFARLPDLQDLELYGNKLSGMIPEEVSNCDNWDKWAPDVNILPQQEGYTLAFHYYESTDFSKDGQVVKLQTHEKGNGINIIITGDCFTDREIASGAFDENARQTMEDFFSIEPFTTFRNLFDVYAVVTVSKTNYHDYGTALNAVFGEGGYVRCDEEKVREYSLKAVNNLDETLTIVVVNKDKNAGTTFMPFPEIETDYGSGFSYACFGLFSQDPVHRSLINHEANGHGFTKLQDEYYYRGVTYPEEDKQFIKDVYFTKGYYANIDFESDPTKVKWANFLSDDRYKYDLLGVFEGGMTAEKGVWRPSENSVMGHHGGAEGSEGTRFNAPSRLAAYYRIHKLAYGSGWEFDYEEFVKYDAINRKTSASASSAHAPEKGAMTAVPHTPPVIMKRPGVR